MFDAGWLVPGWPPERGGRNAGPVEVLVYLEELTKAGIPRTTNPQGLGIIAPSILDYGSEDQVREYALPLLRGERSACLGMSEPGAGSDLASLSTRAVLDGEGFVINGQKVWTSGANYADFCFLFCRTDSDAPKHKGISIVLVDMATPGITVRPLPEIVDPDHPDLNEVFFNDVVVPKDNLVGELNNGWAMANGSLAHERGMVWLTGVMNLEAAAARVRAQAPAALDRLGPRRAGRGGRRPRRVGHRLGGRPVPRLPRLRQAGAGRLRARAGADEGLHQRGRAAPQPAGGRDGRRPHRRPRARPRERLDVDRALLRGLRWHDLGRLVGDPAQHHRREGARPAPGVSDMDKPDYQFVAYETLDEGTIARIMLNRPETRNAQNRGMLVELHDAFLRAEADDQVRVVILGGMGPMFSAGHDMGSKVSIAEAMPGPNQHPSWATNGGTRVGAERLMLQEWHHFFENTRRWRNLRKITVAQVHGDVYAAGLMLMWACDLIVAADDVTFADVVGTRLGMCGVEYFAHPWEFGPRKAKELMLTGDSLVGRRGPRPRHGSARSSPRTSWPTARSTTPAASPSCPR